MMCDYLAVQCQEGARFSLSFLCSKYISILDYCALQGDCFPTADSLTRIQNVLSFCSHVIEIFIIFNGTITKYQVP